MCIRDSPLPLPPSPAQRSSLSLRSLSPLRALLRLTSRMSGAQVEKEKGISGVDGPGGQNDRQKVCTAPLLLYRTAPLVPRALYRNSAGFVPQKKPVLLCTATPLAWARL
eukprot:3431867-Rhodomonas_salina.1